MPTSYAHLLPLFHHPSPTTSFHRADTKAALTSILSSPALRNPSSLQLVEVVVPKLDTPWKLASQLAVRGEAAREYLSREGFTDTFGGWGLEGGVDAGVKWN